MMGKSAATMRRSSSATRSNSVATDRCTSPRATRSVDSPMSARLGQRFHALPHVHEPDVHREHAAVEVFRLTRPALLLQGAAEPIQNALTFFVARGRNVQRAPQDRLGDAVRAFFEEADAQRLRGPQLALGGP